MSCRPLPGWTIPLPGFALFSLRDHSRSYQLLAESRRLPGRATVLRYFRICYSHRCGKHRQRTGSNPANVKCNSDPRKSHSGSVEANTPPLVMDSSRTLFRQQSQQAIGVYFSELPLRDVISRSKSIKTTNPYATLAGTINVSLRQPTRGGSCQAQPPWDFETSTRLQVVNLECHVTERVRDANAAQPAPWRPDNLTAAGGGKCTSAANSTTNGTEELLPELGLAGSEYIPSGIEHREELRRPSLARTQGQTMGPRCRRFLRTDPPKQRQSGNVLGRSTGCTLAQVGSAESRSCESG
ncbi:uncharacterized protein CIMG_12050 [Coccidioides immitis RS]|uniref:Uncharacterized protein n=1 Tax=Coccidioides immitis (strain RS) TaxID=246410 RepID=A0A0D8JU98_COCIM|nr:uncharacterized protein CIMG_12050 [Coccidioides immitis RS]KJF60867.1 hypothetical protein CIMG_12050 [Coccidioides immitis RS]